MNVEIERKFVLSALPSEVEVCARRVETLRQVHVPLVEGDLRLRQSSDGITLGVKGPGDLTRAEWETAAPSWVFELLAKSAARAIHKTRYTVDDSGREWIVDRFDGALHGLVLMECEYESELEARASTLPSWAAHAIEVTHDPRFKNAALASLRDVRPLLVELGLVPSSASFEAMSASSARVS